MEVRTGRFWIALLAVLAPSCGSGGGGGGVGAPTGGGFVVTQLTAFVNTPAGIRHSTTRIDFYLADNESDPVSILVQVSKDGGATWGTATPAFGSTALTGLASSPGGTLHTFLWNSVDDTVATGAGPVNAQVRIRITPADAAPGVAGSTTNFSVDNRIDRVIGVASVLFPHTLNDMGTSEMALGDLVTDALRLRYGVQVALQNGWGVREPLPSSYAPADTTLRRTGAGYASGPPYDLVTGDLYLMLPFGNRVVTRTVTGSQIWLALENGVSAYPANNNGFPQISGINFTFKVSNPPGSRVLSVTLLGGGAILNNATNYTFATNNFVNNGGDGYGMLNDGMGTVREVLAQAVADHVESLSTISPTVGGRMTIVP
jgi:hypothetical protein